MKKIFIIYSMLIASIVFFGCAKQPFKAQDTMSDKALIYIYVKTPEGINDSNRYPRYSVKIDDKYIDGDIEHEEYISMYLNPASVKISAIRATIEAQSLKLDLKPANAYYLRVKSFSDDFAEFDFEEIPENIALDEIKVTKNVTPKEDEKVEVVQALSKSDEIQKAYELKEKGILSNDEFEKLKAEILDANR